MADNQSNVAASTGQFLDSAVSGLYYETASFSGFTDEAGGFSYVPGEYVRFYLGSTFLGEALAQAEVTPLDLLDVQDDPDKLQNMLRILQTIDSDSDPSNGITITDQTNDYLSQFSLPLNEPAVMFEASTVVQDMIAAVTNGSGLKDALSSFEHFHETLLLSRRQTDETIILNLMNTSWTGTVRSSACPQEDAVAKMTLKFTPLGILSNGYHSIDEETCKPKGYGILFETYETSLTFTCANQCLDSDLNRVIIGRDEQTVTTLSHQAGSDEMLLSTVPESGASTTLALQLK
ncbi:MAG: hypothetical protein WBA20_21820 [Ketobacter sp.]